MIFFKNKKYAYRKSLCFFLYYSQFLVHDSLHRLQHDAAGVPLRPGQPHQPRYLWSAVLLGQHPGRSAHSHGGHEERHQAHRWPHPVALLLQHQRFQPLRVDPGRPRLRSFLHGSGRVHHSHSATAGRGSGAETAVPKLTISADIQSQNVLFFKKKNIIRSSHCPSLCLLLFIRFFVRLFLCGEKLFVVRQFLERFFGTSIITRTQKTNNDVQLTMFENEKKTLPVYFSCAC